MKLDPSFVKGYARLGAVLMSLGRLSDEKIMGYVKALERDPKCNAIKDGFDKLVKLEKKIKRELELSRTATEAQRKIRDENKSEMTNSLRSNADKSKS